MRRSSRVLEGRDRDRRGPALVVPLLVVTGLYAVLMFATSLQGVPQFTQVDYHGSDITQPPVTQPPVTTGPQPGEREEPGLILLILQGVAVVVIIAAVLVLLLFGLRLLLRTLVGLWRERPLHRRAAADLTGTDAGAAMASVAAEEAVIRRGIAEALRVIDDAREPGDGIVRAWVGLEETAADAGMARRAAESPGELVVRIVGRRAAIADDVSRLLRLYEGVRFGGGHADEARRAEAARRLARIEEGWR